MNTISTLDDIVEVFEIDRTITLSQNKIEQGPSEITLSVPQLIAKTLIDISSPSIRSASGQESSDPAVRYAQSVGYGGVIFFDTEIQQRTDDQIMITATKVDPFIRVYTQSVWFGFTGVVSSISDTYDGNHSARKQREREYKRYTDGQGVRTVTTNVSRDNFITVDQKQLQNDIASIMPS